MPTIQSKKYPDIVAYVTVEDWENLKKCGVARRKIIIDDSDLQDTVIETPGSFMLEPVSLNREVIKKHRVMSRDEIKAELNKLGIEYYVRASTDKLYQLYLDNQ